MGLHDPGSERFTFVSADLATRVPGFRIGDPASGSEHQPLLLELS